jgi:hypothetical protein
MQFFLLRLSQRTKIQELHLQKAVHRDANWLPTQDFEDLQQQLCP